MKILVIGSGAREHAICWKVAQSERVEKLYAAPGNGGIASTAECIDIKADDIDNLLAFAKDKEIGLTIVGPEAPLVNGIVDKFNLAGLRIFGPDRYGAQLEGSKVFAKELMKRLSIPTADYKVFDNAQAAREYIIKRKSPLVIKADGLAAGKGVIVAESEGEAIAAIDMIMVKKEFGPSGNRVVIEECLSGEEASIISVSDGKDFVTFESSQDHKRIFDDDKGPNTGGMGAYSPAPVVTSQLQKKVETKIISPLIDGLLKAKHPYKGVLYVGIMIIGNEPYVLEFNVRFGDPETQAILPRLKTDLLDIIEASIDGRIKNLRPRWNPRPCVSVVCASGGYPGPYKKGLPIYGLDKVEKLKDITVFHAGTGKTKDGQYETSGGRVLGVTALGRDTKDAIDKAYQACSLVSFEEMHYRKDIGYRALKIVN